MLLGVREPAAREPARSGPPPCACTCRTGARWYEYSLRRLQENPKVAGHVARATLGLS